MKNSSPSEILPAAAAEVGVVLTESALSRFERYAAEIRFWNRKVNLVSLKTPFDLPIKHFVDSLTAVPCIDVPGGSLLDIGTGAGFPGIPIKIALESLRVELLEATGKKVSFLKNVIRKLDLRDIGVIHRRVEDLMQEGTLEGSFDTVISRASFKLPLLIRMGGHFLRAGGILIAMKGRPGEEEVREAAEACSRDRLEFLDARDLRLPVTGDPRKIFRFRKIEPAGSPGTIS